jgi:hypothetical protein
MSCEAIRAVFPITGAERQGRSPSSTSDAAREAGPAAPAGFGRITGDNRSRLSRDRSAALTLSLLPSRRAMTKTRLVRHGNTRFRSEPFASLVS